MTRAKNDKEQDIRKYPTRENSVRRWEQLARDIVASKRPLRDDLKAKPASRPGSLTVIGSGIQSVGFTLDAAERIRRADEVFYCVADAATQVWIRELRPDAFDLYVLYDDPKIRYSTYVQMTEAMLHYVRAGKDVVTVFYGHPGIFVLSTHRAIAIARREGHRATMFAGISALDCLCADLAVDPSYPGMQTYEATDLLLRRRPLDPSLHTVLWQVGLIGEMGYRRRGYINDKFPLLVEYLAESYGEDYWITHYIAARYPTMSPQIAHHPIRALLEPATRATFNGISTFYIAPQVARENDAEMAVRLGLVEPGQPLGRVARRRQIDRYGPRERDGVDGFVDFKVPDTYQFQRKTRAAEFLVELTRNHKLARLFTKDPRRAVSDDVFPGLSRQERRLLMSRDEGRMQLAAKGMLVGLSPDEQFVVDVLQRPALARGFKTVLAANCRDKTGRSVIDAWIKAQGYDTCFANFEAASANVSATMLLPWSAVYGAADGTVITILGDPQRNANSQVWLNCSRITDFTFANGVLAWSDFGGGQITFQIASGAPGTYQRTLSGRVGEQSAFSADEVVLDAEGAVRWCGAYDLEITADPSITPWEPYGRLVLDRSADGGVAATLNGAELPNAVVADDSVSWYLPDGTLYGIVRFSRDATAPGGRALEGAVFPMTPGPVLQGACISTDPGAYLGQYVAQALGGGAWSPAPPVYLATAGIQIGSQVIPATAVNGLVTWSGGPSGCGNGRLQFLVDPVTQLPYFNGKVWDGTAEPPGPNLRGQFAPKMLDSWSGTYPTTLGSAAGPSLRVVGAAPPHATAVLYQGQPVAAYSFINGDLHATTQDGSTLSVSFAYDGKTASRSFSGQLTQKGAAQTWASDGASNDLTQWIGRYVTLEAAANGAFAPSATTVQILSDPVTGYSVVLSDGATAVTLAADAIAYDPTYSTLSWAGQAGTPGGGAYANASIALVRSDEHANLTFIGSYWNAGAKPPASANWSGVVQDQTSGSGGYAWKAVAIALGATFGLMLVGAAIWLRFTSRVAQQTSEVEMQSLLCKEKVDLACASYALGAAADPCQQQEEDAEEEEDGLDADDEAAADANPADMPAESGLTVDAEPNINVDVDTDVDVDVNIDVDVDVDVDVDIDVDIDVDVLFVDVDVDIDVDIDTDIDNVTDTVDVTDIDTVSVIST